MQGGLINIDKRGVAVVELDARVELDEAGRPGLEPLRGTAGRWRTALARHAGKGPLRIAITRVTERRSHAQNRLLWRVYGQILDGLRELAAEVGEVCPFRDTEDVHAAMKHLFIGPTVVRFNGEELEIPATTTRLTVEQFSSYLKAIVGYWAKKAIYVEMPGEAA
jgi:hypothetical protein